MAAEAWQSAARWRLVPSVLHPDFLCIVLAECSFLSFPLSSLPLPIPWHAVTEDGPWERWSETSQPLPQDANDASCRLSCILFQKKCYPLSGGLQTRSHRLHPRPSRPGRGRGRQPQSALSPIAHPVGQGRSHENARLRPLLPLTPGLESSSLQGYMQPYRGSPSSLECARVYV